MSTLQQEIAASTVLPCATTSVPAARRFVHQALRPFGRSHEVDLALLLTSELATNAVRHARSSFGLNVTVGHERVRVETVDGSPTPPVVRGVPTDAPGGKGMVLVSTLASDWGYRPTADGKTVWFELRLPKRG